MRNDEEGAAGTARFTGFAPKTELLSKFAGGRRVLHLGAVGCTLQSTEAKIAAARQSVHAFLTRISTCVGIDIDTDAVEALTEAGIFDNLIAGDVEALTRDQIPLPFIDLIVAGDVIEHLSNPGRMLDGMWRLSDPDTHLLVTTPNAMGLPNFLRYSLGRFRDSPDHVSAFNPITLANLLDRHGWVVEEQYTCHQAGASSRNALVLFRAGTALFKLFPRLGGTLFVIARKADLTAKGR